MQKIVPHVKRLNCLIVTCSMCILLKELLESDMLLCAQLKRIRNGYISLRKGDGS